jgi:cytoskeletal protein CcmA (bactofilin family)
MFDRNKSKQAAVPDRQEARPSPASASTSPGQTTSRSKAMIGPSIVIKGTVSGDEDLVIQGKVEGSVELGAHEVSVGQSGQVNADVTARVVRIDGEVAGDIRGHEKVVITQSGNVRGNIIAPRVTLEDGAIFKGSIDMDPGEESPRVSLAPEAAEPEDDIAPGFDLKSG